MRGVKQLLTVASALSLAGCGPNGSPSGSNSTASTEAPQAATTSAPPQDAAPAQVPAFQASFVPKAPGKGNFEVCLGKEAKENGVSSVTLPPRLIFQSWGQLTGDLRDSQSYDKSVMGSTTPESKAKMSYGVVLTQPVTLTLSVPCRITTANAVTHDGFDFSHEVVPVELHLSFGADALLMETMDDDITNQETPGSKATANVLGMGLIFGTPVGDVGNVRRLVTAG
jgi:hypothetical protein